MKKKTTEEFIKESKSIHGNKYDYSCTIYVGAREKVKIICPEHGIFEQIASNHLNGKECNICGINKRAVTQSKTTNNFIKDALLIHNKNYDYSLTEYINSSSKVKIICPKHGIFEQLPDNHLIGCGCPKCKGSDISNRCRSSSKDFINKAKLVHSDKYDYYLVEYKTARDKIKIICPNHGVFSQIPNSHLNGKGCLKCSIELHTSKGEKEVLEYVKSIYNGQIIENSRKIIKPYELDIFLPELNVGIEYNGTYWHKLHEERKPGYHKIKKELCQQNNITLLNVAEEDWAKNKLSIKNFLLNVLKKDY